MNWPGKYGQLSFNDIYEVVTTTNNPEVFKEIEREIPKENPEPDNISTDTVQKPDLGVFEGTTLYFDNDKPDSNTRSTTSTVDYDTSYSAYIGHKRVHIFHKRIVLDKNNRLRLSLILKLLRVKTNLMISLISW